MIIKTKRGARRARNQRVIDRRFVVTSSSHGVDITPGKLYRVYKVKGWLCPHIDNDDGMSIGIMDVGYNCCHLGDVDEWHHPFR